MPQAKRGGTGSKSSGKPRTASAQSKRSSAGGPAGAKAKTAGATTKPSTSTRAASSSSRSRAAKPATSRRTNTSTARKAASTAPAARARNVASSAASQADAKFDATAKRLRRLNERIIEASKEAGETTLTSYERALKAIASSLEKGPGASDIEWISHLASTQAKYLRDVTTAWTSAARNVLK
ncbi:MAG: hypothetical protein ACYC91_09005 [Solirubrobacteraceae bacterium]